MMFLRTRVKRRKENKEKKETNLVGAFGNHGIDGHTDELRGYPFASVVLFNSQHGDVTT